MPFIELKHVSKQLKKQILLDDISLTIDQGEIATLEGINGSGKTVLLKALLGLIKTSGRITVAKKPVSVDVAYPIMAGILIENPSLIENLSAFKNLELLALLQDNISSEDIMALLNRLNLGNVAAKKVKSFSLGMKQKLGIAQALLGKHPLIVLDEPTNALDQESLENLVQLIKEINQQGATFIIASHDSNFVEQLATHRFYMKEGKVHEA